MRALAIVMTVVLVAVGGMVAHAADNAPATTQKAGDDFGARFNNAAPAALPSSETATPQNIEPAAGDSEDDEATPDPETLPDANGTAQAAPATPAQPAPANTPAPDKTAQ